MSSTDFQQVTAEQLLGPLNDVEQKHAPEMLYVAGDAGIMQQGARVSIVGSRKASDEGLARARRLAGLLVTHQVVVVSGLAEGIDAAAHTTAMEQGGRTVAVIGTPLDKVYPKKNTDLQHEIMREHLVVSQFPIGYPTQPKNFPMRNRTMALLSDATVIVEASDSSGSLSQAAEALRLGRGLFITKALADNTSLKWPEEMLHYGGKILSDDTLDEFVEFLLLAHRTEANFNGAVPF